MPQDGIPPDYTPPPGIVEAEQEFEDTLVNNPPLVTPDNSEAGSSSSLSLSDADASYSSLMVELMNAINKDGNPNEWSSSEFSAWESAKSGFAGTSLDNPMVNEETRHFMPLPGGGYVMHGEDPYKEPLIVQPYRETPETCRGKCAKQDKLAKQHCDMVRKRVGQWFKDTGCPSSIKGFKMKSKCGRKKAVSVASKSSVKSVKGTKRKK